MVNTGFRRAVRRLRLEREARAAAALEQARAIVEDATAEPMGTPTVGGRRIPPDSPRTLLIGSERDAAAAFGEESQLHQLLRESFGR